MAGMPADWSIIRSGWSAGPVRLLQWMHFRRESRNWRDLVISRFFSFQIVPVAMLKDGFFGRLKGIRSWSSVLEEAIVSIRIARIGHNFSRAVRSDPPFVKELTCGPELSVEVFRIRSPNGSFDARYLRCPSGFCKARTT